MRRRYFVSEESGLGWVGLIPRGWRAHRLKHLAVLNREVLPEDTDPDYEIAYIDISAVDSRGLIDRPAEMPFRDAPSRARRTVREGDVIVSTVRTYLRAIAPIIRPPANLVVSTGFAVVSPGGSLDAHFISYALRASYFVESVVARSDGVSYPAISSTRLAELGLVVPPIREQRAIADYLGRETARIDALVEKKRRLIELLREKRTALISRVVTKGLDPEVQMKASGIDWLGEVPAHWADTKMRALVEARGGSTPSKDRPDYWEGEVPWVSPKDMKVATLADSMDHLSETALTETGLRRVPEGSVLIVVRGMILAHTFPVAKTTVPVTLNQDMKALIPRAGLEPNFLAYMLRGIKGPLLATVEDSAHGTKRLRTDLFMGQRLYLPPMGEQRAIVVHLDRETAGIDALVDKVERAIALLTEYRSALISAAVTGEIDIGDEVREEVVA